MNRCRIVFFDRDGIVNKRIVGDYVRLPAEFVFCEGFFPLFRWVKEAGYRAIIVSNQQGVAKGIMSHEQLWSLTAWMQERVYHYTGYKFDDIYYCTELDTPAAQCRKPRPTMLLEALAKWNGDATQSWMIGDMPSDVEAATGAGVRAILVGDYALSDAPTAYAIVPTLAECLALLQAESKVHH
ncbi:MAG: HAD-IIIA family hydrolase [Bacteroidota bacterium]|nr:HAD-IIIA family hydrolase [Candidatus Kapabacteria bacterium]MCS7302584.1 HAD-IIIA family hydrolase [Candidatus Kapabacteria bacterium]MCX7936719.1 HAD-IIIA family hydrolase [Chlorobiota bacterium]MDW8074237.1 HAD-IIIA family hydrolase [Bacteroidota bacterium]MDW8271287.1 HAD-IIIA family hydrolase [Bacteroidota bacterium]